MKPLPPEPDRFGFGISFSKKINSILSSEMSASSLLKQGTNKIDPAFIPSEATSTVKAPFNIVSATDPTSTSSTNINETPTYQQTVITLANKPNVDYQFYTANTTNSISLDVINGVEGVSIGAGQEVYAGNLCGFIAPYNISNNSGVPLIGQICPYINFVNIEDIGPPYGPGGAILWDVSPAMIGAYCFVDMGNIQGFSAILNIDSTVFGEWVVSSAIWVSVPDPTNNVPLAINWQGNTLYTIVPGDTKQYMFVKTNAGFVRVERA